MIKECPCCGEDFDSLYYLARCGNVCDKCCPKLEYCTQCEWYYIEDEEEDYLNI
jgi:hypothetical protein